MNPESLNWFSGFIVFLSLMAKKSIPSLHTKKEGALALEGSPTLLNK